MLKRFRTKLVQTGPALLRFPVQLTPFVIKKEIIESMLTWQFRHALEEDELSFLTDRWLKVEIYDLSFCWLMTLKNNKLVIAENAEPDVIFSASTNDFILIAAKRLDPDTAFFQRRLSLEGDTELGLYVKNLMDSIELDSMPLPLRIGLLQLANIIEASVETDIEPSKRESVSC